MTDRVTGYSACAHDRREESCEGLAERFRREWTYHIVEPSRSRRWRRNKREQGLVEDALAEQARKTMLGEAATCDCVAIE